MDAKNVIGVQLDFENNFAVGSVLNNGSIKVVRDLKGNYKVPMCVSITDYNTMDKLFGGAAELYKDRNPESLFIEFGCLFAYKLDRGNFIDKLDGFVLRDVEGTRTIRIKSSEYNISSWLSLFLRNWFAKEEIIPFNQIKTNSVLTLPDHFQQQNVWKVIEKTLKYNIIPESYAITQAYGQKEELGPNYLVCHLTEATTAVYHYHGEDKLQSLQINTIESIVGYCAEYFQLKFGCDVTADDFLMNKLREESKKALKVLRTSNEYVIKIDGTLFCVTISQETFRQELYKDWLRKAFKDLLFNTTASYVLFSGSFALLPSIRQFFLRLFNEDRLFLAAAPDLVVSHGAAVVANKKVNPSQSMRTVTLIKYSAELEVVTESDKELVATKDTIQDNSDEDQSCIDGFKGMTVGVEEEVACQNVDNRETFIDDILKYIYDEPSDTDENSDTEKTLEATDMILQDPKTFDVYLKRGECYYNEHLFKEALSDLQQYVREGGVKDEFVKTLIQKTKLQIVLRKINECIANNNFNEADHLISSVEKADLAVLKYDRLRDKFAEVKTNVGDTFRERTGLKFHAKGFEAQRNYEAAIENLKKVHEMENSKESQAELNRVKKLFGQKQKREHLESQYNIKFA